MKVYGKLIARARKNSNGSPYGFMDRTLEIYEIKTGLKGVPLKSSEKVGKRKKMSFLVPFSEQRTRTPLLKEYVNTLVSLIHR